MFENEIFVPIFGWEEYYQVSNLGRIKSLQRTVLVKRSPNNFYRNKKEIFIKIHFCKTNGYKMVCLQVENKMKNYLLHRLIASAFVPNPNKYDFVNHIDGNKLNNSILNLEWCTKSQNTYHAFRNGLNDKAIASAKARRGELASCVKLTEKDVVSLRSDWASGSYTHKQLGIKYGIGPTSSASIIQRRSWKHVK